MVIFHGIVTPFLVSIFISLMILSINSLPQNYNENLNWRYQPRPYHYNGYYANQRSYHPEYHHLSNPSSSYESYGYHRPHIQPETIALLRPRSRGPSKEVLPEPSSKRNQFNSSEDGVNQANAERGDRRIEATNKKETTRILNSPPVQVPKTSPDSDVMLDDQNDFVFPEHPILQPSTPPPMKSFVPDVNKVMSMCGSDAIFCDFRGNYPSELIKKALSKTSVKYGDLLGRDQITSNVSISTRFDVTNDGTPMCGSKEKIIEPPAAKNKDNEWKWIVNEGPYVQGIRVEMCDDPDSQCQMAENFPIGYKTECKQKFIYRKLLVLEKSGQIEPDTFRLPSCCACIYRQDTASRFMKPAFGTSPRRK